MKKAIFVFPLFVVFSAAAYAQPSQPTSPPPAPSPTAAAKTVPENFKSDGCSMFPDGCYRECCVEHDKAYYLGGTKKERRAADRALFKCVAAKKGWWHKTFVAPLMWAGVRVGGVGFLPTPFRWGFGQKKEPKKTSPKNKQTPVPGRAEEAERTTAELLPED